MAQEKLLDVEIVTPQKTLYSDKAVSVSVPGSLSPFQILHNHAPIVSTLDIGIVKIENASENLLFFAVSSGFVEVHDNHVSILVEFAEQGSGINADEAQKTFDSARERMKELKENTEEMNLTRQEALLAETRLKAAEKQKEY